MHISFFHHPVTAHLFYCQINLGVGTGGINTTDCASLMSPRTADVKVSPLVLLAAEFSPASSFSLVYEGLRRALSLPGLAGEAAAA